MLWARAVWKEGERFYEDTIPYKWIINGTGHWPVGVNSSRAINEHRSV